MINVRNEFEKWRATCASVSGVRAWVTLVTCLCGRRASMGRVFACVAWIGWVAC